MTDEEFLMFLDKKLVDNLGYDDEIKRDCTRYHKRK